MMDDNAKIDENIKFIEKLEKGERELDLLDPDYSFSKIDLEDTMEINIGDINE